MLVYGCDEALMNAFIDRMTNKEEAKFRREGTAEGYLGIDIKRDENK